MGNRFKVRLKELLRQTDKAFSWTAYLIGIRYINILLDLDDRKMCL